MEVLEERILTLCRENPNGIDEVRLPAPSRRPHPERGGETRPCLGVCGAKPSLAPLRSERARQAMLASSMANVDAHARAGALNALLQRRRLQVGVPPTPSHALHPPPRSPPPLPTACLAS